MTPKIVIAHNFYRSATPSGENKMVEEIASLLEYGGAEVIPFFRSSDSIPALPLPRKLWLPISPVYSQEAVQAFKEVVQLHRPDVLQVHNPFPLISPAIIRAAHGTGVRVVNFIHNYRHICMATNLLRDGHECRLCVQRHSNVPGVRYGCYRGSRAQSAVMAASAFAHRGTWRLVDRFVAVSEFAKQQLVAGGFDGTRIAVRYNTVPDPGSASPPGRLGFFFAGRLTPEKGVDVLLEAWRLAELDAICTLEIAGSGPLEPVVRAASSGSPGLKFVGKLGGAKLAAAYRRAAVVVLPSTCAEACPLTVLEAFSYGRAVLGTTMGGVPELVDESVGWTCAPDQAALADVLKKVASNLDLVRAKGDRARIRYRERYEPKASVQRLLELHTQFG